MKAPKAPAIDARRKREFAEELRERARVWMPTWAFDDVEGDFGKALLEIAARFDTEVAERLDQAGEKMRRSFLDWLGVQGEAARPARMPVVFKLADTAQDAVIADPPVRMQVEADGASLIFETETKTDLRLVPGRMDTVIGVDAKEDAIYLPPPGLSDLKPLEPLPVEWKLKTFASAGSVKLQLEPAVGLSEGMTIKVGGRHYRIEEADNGIVTIDPPLEADQEKDGKVSKVEAFAPFDSITRNRQEHALYIGDDDLLNIEAAAVIEVVGARSLSSRVKWQYWGKTDKKEEVPDWRELTISKEQNGIGLRLEKGEGAIEQREIGNVSSRWIRAFYDNPGTLPTLFEADSLQLRVNCKNDLKCPMLGSAQNGVEVEAMANTTPLVIDKPFLPLGRVPRQFDAFYLGSKEAFSKSGATAQLSLTISDRSFKRLSALRHTSLADMVMAGVARDSSLHLLLIDPASGTITDFRGRGPLQPPSPKYLDSEAKTGRIALHSEATWQLPVWPEDASAAVSGFLVGTTAKDQVWIWREHSTTPSDSGWMELGRLGDGSSPDMVVQGLVYLGGVSEKLVALYNDEMFVRSWSVSSPEAAWQNKITKDGTDVVTLALIVPILVKDIVGRLVTSDLEGMIGVAQDGKLYTVSSNGACTPISKFNNHRFRSDIHPVAIKIGSDISIAGVTAASSPTDHDKLVTHNGSAGSIKSTAFEDGANVVVSLEARLIGSDFHIMATVQDNSGTRLTTWAPYATDPSDKVFNSRIGSTGIIVEPGAPLSIGNFVVVPAGRADILSSQYVPSQRTERTNLLEHGFLTSNLFPQLVEDDLVVRYESDGTPQIIKVRDFTSTEDDKVLYELDHAFIDPEDLSEPDVFYLSHTSSGTLNNAGDELTLDPSDTATDEGDHLLIDTVVHKVTLITPSGSDRIATLVPNSIKSGAELYVRGISKTGRVVPFMNLNTTLGQSGDWDAGLLNRVNIVFPDGTPKQQRATAFKVDTTSSPKPDIIILNTEFTSVPNPSNPAKFIVDAAFSAWMKNSGDTSANAELSWEYWSGKGWSKLDLTHDNTENLKSSGAICFKVPDDIAESDWAGKTNFWIRARLIEGDYGQEEVKVVTKGNEQTVVRLTDNVKAPQALSIKALYSICKEVLPKHVLAKDNETIVDQSDANNTQGAIVEGFVPVGLALGRLSRQTKKNADAHDCPPDCKCQKCPGHDKPAQAAPPASGEKEEKDEVSEKGRAIFIGLDAKVSAGTVSILLMVDKEAPHLNLAPMEIAALVGGQFKPLVVDDATRALGESGLLLLSFAVAPTLSTLFGKTLIWLRLKPKEGTDEEWGPSIKGAYLNAAYASSKETLTRELLGSSNGSPGLALNLARPPVLRDTLELRVLEPLGEEERRELADLGDGSLLSDVEGLPGDWVLWRKVTNTDDVEPRSRVYMLDETTGEVRFGDGKHGRIPPIGRNNIVAFGYSRTEPGRPGSVIFPANSVKARTPLNLVSPVERVESVIAAGQAVGGSPPETDEAVLRFGFSRLRHRGRAVTARDLEDLAVESSPEIVQARAVKDLSGIRLVVMMRGRAPQPSAGQARELHRLLLEASPVALSASQALRIEGPRIRRLRIELLLEVERLEHAAQISNWVNEEITRFFDTGFGGMDGSGWPLGLRVSEEDIAYILNDAPLLSGIRDIKCFESLAGGTEKEGAITPQSTEIVMLDDDPVRIRFETAEVVV